jgi:hypothetical protein
MMDPEMDMHSKTYYARLEWAGTMKIIQPTAVVAEKEVDLAS